MEVLEKIFDRHTCLGWWHHHHMLNKEMHFIDQHQTQVKLFNVGTANHPWHLKPWCCCNGKCHYQDRVSTTWAYLRPRSQSHLAQHLRTWGTMNFLAAGVRFVRRFWVLVCVMKLTNIHWDALPTRMQSWPPGVFYCLVGNLNRNLHLLLLLFGKGVSHPYRISSVEMIRGVLNHQHDEGIKNSPLIFIWPKCTGPFCRVSPADDMKKDQTWLQVEWFAAENWIQLL